MTTLSQNIVETSETLRFPAGFLWGAATSAHQVEGGNRNNDWWEWEQQPGHITDGSRSGRAVEWWAGRAEEDLRRAAAMGHSAHRLSLEWSRLEPSPGVYDAAAFERYRAILGTMQELGMAASVTLYHFTLPRWAARAGSWLNDELPAQFGRFAAECVRRLGDQVAWWATINEPMILVYQAYVGRHWPPALGSMSAGLQAARNLLRAHHVAYLQGKGAAPDAQIGIVLNVPALDPARTHPLDRGVARVQDEVMNGITLRALETGRLPFPLARRGENLPAGPGAADWYGVNYYGQHVNRFDMSRPGELFGRQVQEGVRSETGNWGNIYPEGLTRALVRVAKLGKPLFVTENGIFDPQDTRRPAYLLHHLRATHEAIRQGVDVRGYFHWSLVDNFEWAEGWSTPFGLLAVDPTTQARQPRRSALLYEQVIRANAISPEMWGEVVRRQ